MADYINGIENVCKRVAYIDQFIPSIITECKVNNNFDNAAKIMKKNGITIEELSQRTIRLSIDELAQLIDKLIALK